MCRGAGGGSLRKAKLFFTFTSVIPWSILYSIKMHCIHTLINYLHLASHSCSFNLAQQICIWLSQDLPVKLTQATLLQLSSPSSNSSFYVYGLFALSGKKVVWWRSQAFYTAGRLDEWMQVFRHGALTRSGPGVSDQGGATAWTDY